MSPDDTLPASVDDPVLSRALSLRHDDGTITGVVVRFDRPRPLEDGGDFGCTWQVIGFGDDRTRLARGVDTLQAMLLAIQQAGIYLSCSTAAREGRLFWLDAGNPPTLPVQFHHGPDWRDDL